MGTKFEHSINPLAVGAIESNNFSVSGVDVWEYYQKKRLTGINNKLKDPISMDRNSMESIKKTMQMQEDIFKHQVKELHSVYNVQKMLMEELKKESREKNVWTAMNGLEISLPSHHLRDQQQHQRRTQTSYGPNLRVQSLNDNCSRERSGSCSGGDTKKMPQRGFDLARPAKEEDEGGEAGPSSYTAFESCKIRNDDDYEDMEVDLTLSIGGSSSSQGKKMKKKKEKNHVIYSSASFKSDRGGECSEPNTSMSSSSVTFDQERKGGTHWLSQDLRLK